MRLTLLSGLLFISCVSTTAYANDFSVGLNDDVISTDFALDLNKNINAVLGYIYSNDGGHLTSAAIHVSHDAGVHHFEVGAEFSYVWAKKSPNGSAVGVGGRYKMDLGSNLSFNASGYYAPSVLSFGSVDGQYELDSKMQFQLNPNLALFTGYRYIRFQYDNTSNSTFDSGFYIGAAARF
ncbi:YfaZ family protein [Shewanella sp. D64]|uniref:YfaZ family outer membrane protein n=1 Tax=unclassified Shewanella TaxID=196818 RepID=UPI0022BA1476|nr:MULTISPECIES: YfaZ family outer membrane protein [unclassified Shewanella]MEC4726459.1 YfaZ family protein [Shewanella sp. D64]MEC4738471.1 YfaZ family protein [Shewanella sp. E94]WBJ94128.1 YfaZ family protein [Shewanella sp. MTB7]